MDTNPIALRDRLLDDAPPAQVEAEIRALLACGWPVPAILAELPTVPVELVMRTARGARARAAA